MTKPASAPIEGAPVRRGRVDRNYREFLAPDPSTLLTESIERRIHALDSVLKVVAEQDHQVGVLQQLLPEDKVLASLSSSTKLRAIGMASEVAKAALNRLLQILDRRYRKLDLKQDVTLLVIKQLINNLEELQGAASNCTGGVPEVGPQRKKLLSHLKSRLLELVRDTSILKNVFGEYRASLMLERRAKEAKQPIPQRKTPALFAEVDNLDAMLQGFRKKGWTVNLRNDDAEPDQEDGWVVSMQLLDRVRRPKQELLPKEQKVGILRFPCLMRLHSKPTDAAIDRCLVPKVEYNVYLVLGGYLVVDNCLAVGVNRKLLEDKKGRPEIRTSTFLTAIQYIQQHAPEWQPSLQVTRPVLPIKLAGQHYYILLMPDGTIGESRNAISDWGFLSY